MLQHNTMRAFDEGEPRPLGEAGRAEMKACMAAPLNLQSPDHFLSCMS